MTDDVDMIAATRCGATKAWQDYGETNGKVNKIRKAIISAKSAIASVNANPKIA